jgi:two-component sensor histidine kinase
MLPNRSVIASVATQVSSLNEERESSWARRFGACLEAQDGQVGARLDHIVLFANNCSDGIVEVARAVGDGIEALRMVHKKIYRTADGLDYTCLGTYLADLAASLLAFHGGVVVTKVRLVSEIQNINVPAEIAIPFGLIASEFITNSLNYAFGGGRGRIGLQIEETEGNGSCPLAWCSNGVAEQG